MPSETSHHRSLQTTEKTPIINQNPICRTLQIPHTTLKIQNIKIQTSHPRSLNKKPNKNRQLQNPRNAFTTKPKTKPLHPRNTAHMLLPHRTISRTKDFSHRQPRGRKTGDSHFATEPDLSTPQRDNLSRQSAPISHCYEEDVAHHKYSNIYHPQLGLATHRLPTPITLSTQEVSTLHAASFDSKLPPQTFIHTTPHRPINSSTPPPPNHTPLHQTNTTTTPTRHAQQTHTPTHRTHPKTPHTPSALPPNQPTSKPTHHHHHHPHYHLPRHWRTALFTMKKRESSGQRTTQLRR